MASDKITSLQVAKRAGVSQSAVSRVFTPGASASKKTVEKVRKAAAELGYRPNALARAMITGKSRIIGLVVAYLDNYFYPVVIERLSVALQERGYHVLVFMAASTIGDVESVMQEILDYQVDGIVLASVSMSSVLAAQCQSHGIPVVLFNRDQDDARLSSVTTDNVTGGRIVAEHLIATGHQRIAYIAGFEGASTQRDRELGFLSALAAAGQKLYRRGLGEFEHPATREATLEMFSGADRPDAVFVCNDHMAFAVIDTLRTELGLGVPQDVSVVGFDDVPIAAWPAYDLTSYRQPVNQMVAETVTTLIERIETPDTEPRRLRLEGRLVLRGSSRNEKRQDT
ncbi:MAG: LacI family DNA-binding transcriptional regulator [Paracoccaceae bacterium]